MSTLAINAIAAQLLLDESFQDALMNGHGQECLAAFHLTDHERVAILTIHSESPRQFINELSKLMQSSIFHSSYRIIEKKSAVDSGA